MCRRNVALDCEKPSPHCQLSFTPDIIPGREHQHLPHTKHETERPSATSSHFLKSTGQLRGPPAGSTHTVAPAR